MYTQRLEASEVNNATLGELRPLLLPTGDASTITARQRAFATSRSHRLLRFSDDAAAALLARLCLVATVFIFAAAAAVITWQTMSPSARDVGGKNGSGVPKTNRPRVTPRLGTATDQHHASGSSFGDKDRLDQSEKARGPNHTKRSNSISTTKSIIANSISISNQDEVHATVKSPPNVIFILLDDVGMNDMGYTSTDDLAITPFMDSLALEGVRISDYYTAHLCTPARVSLLRGHVT